MSLIKKHFDMDTAKNIFAAELKQVKENSINKGMQSHARAATQALDEMKKTAKEYKMGKSLQRYIKDFEKALQAHMKASIAMKDALRSFNKVEKTLD